MTTITSIRNRTLQGRLEIQNSSSRVEKIFHSFAALIPEIFFNTRREIFFLHAAMKYPLFILFSLHFQRVAGLSIRAGGRGFPPATQSMAPGYFRR